VRYLRECSPSDQFPHPRIETTGGGVESPQHAPHIVLPPKNPGSHPVLDQLAASQFCCAAGEPVIGKMTGQLPDRWQREVNRAGGVDIAVRMDQLDKPEQ
jgi:hypothetical protein